MKIGNEKAPGMEFQLEGYVNPALTIPTFKLLWPSRPLTLGGSRVNMGTTCSFALLPRGRVTHLKEVLCAGWGTPGYPG